MAGAAVGEAAQRTEQVADVPEDVVVAAFGDLEELLAGEAFDLAEEMVADDVEGFEAHGAGHGELAFQLGSICPQITPITLIIF